MTKLQNSPSRDEHSGQDKSHSRRRCSLTREFWDHFIEKHWEQEEFVQNDQSVALPISQEALFDSLVDMSERQIAEFERTGELCNSVRVYVGDNRDDLTEGYFHLFPKKEDKNFSAYSKRVEQELDGEEFSFVIDAIDMSPNLKAWSKEFLKGMYRPLKKISYGHFWSIFYGNYTTTPYGVHDHTEGTQAESAFYFPITGNKQMITWRPDYVEQHPELIEARDYSKHESVATVLSADQSGMMYWPSDRWHIGSSAGGDVSIVLAVRAFSDGYATFETAFFSGLFDQFIRSQRIVPLGDFWFNLYMAVHRRLLRVSKRARAKQIRSLPFDPDDLQGCAATIPLEVRKIGKPFAFIFGKKIEHVLSLFWLVHLSTLGLIVESERLPAIKPTQSLRIRRHAGTIILWRQIDNQTILVVSDTHYLEVPLWFLPMIKTVVDAEEGQELLYGDLAKLSQEITSEGFDENLSQFVSFLVESHGFEQLEKAE